MRRSARARSKFKVELCWNTALSAQELHGEVVFERDACEGVLEEFGVRSEPGLPPRDSKKFTVDAASDAGCLALQQPQPAH